MTFKNETYKYIADLIFKTSGIVYDEKEYFRLDSRINALLRFSNMTNEGQLIQEMQRNPLGPIVSELVDLSTNNETYFFRDVKPFVSITKLIEEKMKMNGLRHLSIWSAGCSSGQEPYSLTMTLLEHFPSLDFQILATDLSESILNKARSGLYTQLEVSRGLEPSLLAKYFTKEGNFWKISSRISSHIKFQKLNLLTENFAKESYDLVLCRNVLIYQNFQNRQAIMRKLANSLKHDGALILGSGESIIGMDIELKMSMINGTMVFVRDDKKRQAA